jgi:hypothetical protein
MLNALGFRDHYDVIIYTYMDVLRDHYAAETLAPSPFFFK